MAASMLWGQLGVFAARQHQLGAMGEESGAPPSSVSIWACAWQMTDPCGGTRLASARQLAAVPLATQIAVTGWPNSAEKASSSAAQAVIVIGRLRGIGGLHRGPYGGVHRGGIVGKKLHGPCVRGQGSAVKAAKGRGARVPRTLRSLHQMRGLHGHGEQFVERGGQSPSVVTVCIR
jgi:hypothetical protein